jgi:hypothetical protein
MISYVVNSVCSACGVERKCMRVGLDTLDKPIDLCADDLAQALQEVSGFKIVNMYRTMKVQSETKDPKASVHNTRTILPRRAK